MNIFNSLYYYTIPFQHNIKIDDHYDYSVISTHAEKISHDTHPEIEVFIIEDKDMTQCIPNREFTPDSLSTLDICVSPENLKKIDNMFENKTIEEVVEYYENKMINEKLATDKIIDDIKIIESKCNIIILLLIFYLFLPNSCK
jgi:hypothetical protein